MPPSVPPQRSPKRRCGWDRGSILWHDVKLWTVPKNPVNNLQQIGVGLIGYTSENRGFFPAPVLQNTTEVDFLGRRPHLLSGLIRWPYPRVRWNLEGIFFEIFETPLTSGIFRCPLMVPKRDHIIPYNLYFGKINPSMISLADPMMKIGQTYVISKGWLDSTGKRFSLLGSDDMLIYPNTGARSTHDSPDGTSKYRGQDGINYGGNPNNDSGDGMPRKGENGGWSTPVCMNLDANYVDADGSAKNYGNINYRDGRNNTDYMYSSYWDNRRTGFRFLFPRDKSK